MSIKMPSGTFCECCLSSSLNELFKCSRPSSNRVVYNNMSRGTSDYFNHNWLLSQAQRCLDYSVWRIPLQCAVGSSNWGTSQHYPLGYLFHDTLLLPKQIVNSYPFFIFCSTSSLRWWKPMTCSREANNLSTSVEQWAMKHISL